MKHFNIFLGLSILGCLLSFAKAEVFSSAKDMKAIYHIEADLIDILKGHASKIQAKIDRIDRYIQDLNIQMSERQPSDTEEEFEERVVGNPIHAYKIVKRFAIDWPKVEKELTTDDWEETSFEMKKRSLSNRLPEEEDLHLSAQALIRLVDTYDIDVRRLSRGILEVGDTAIHTGAKLTAQDCLFVGKHCFNNGNLARSLEWFEHAWVLAGEEGNKTISQEKVREILETAAERHDNDVRMGLKRYDDLLPKPVDEVPPFKQRELFIKDFNDRIKNATDVESAFDQQLAKYGYGESTNKDNLKYKMLCRGVELRPQEYVTKLKCSYSYRNHPYFYLHPILVEQLHTSPDVVMFHDVISPMEMERLKELAAPLLQRSSVVNHDKPVGTNKRDDRSRTSASGFLPDGHDQLIAQLAKRVAMISGLSTDPSLEDAEQFQVATYINGGHYITHLDVLRRHHDPKHVFYAHDKQTVVGERIATFLFYLNDVPLGGSTVFPRIGAAVKPVKGSAVFWYNLLENGDPDQDSHHGACPIVYGIKAISNKWIREAAQQFRRLCKLANNFVAIK